MSDQCYVTMTLRREDLERFGKVLGLQPGMTWWDDEISEPAPGVIEVGLCDANYALYPERQKAAGEGLTFLGQHEAGDEYCPYGFVALNKEMHEVEVDGNGHIILPVDRDLKLVGDLDIVRRYIEKVRAVEALFGIVRHVEQPQQPDKESGIAA